MSVDATSGSRIGLYYFEDVLAVEFAAIALRRRRRPEGLHQDPVAPNPPSRPPPAPDALMAAGAKAGRHNRRRSPDPETFFRKVGALLDARAAHEPYSLPPDELSKPDEDKQRPMPLPCDATGLALSGGGVRSAAIGLGVLQALNVVGRLGSFDYLSTVSGGGYIGATLSAGLAESGLPAAELSPLGGGVEDSPAVAHLRDFSNYLLPRGRSAVQNLGDAAAVLLRGLVANGVHVLAALLFLALATRVAYPALGRLEQGNYLASLVAGLIGQRWLPEYLFGAHPFGLTKLLSWLLALVLIVWAVARSPFGKLFWGRVDSPAKFWSDTDSPAISMARVLVVSVAVSAFLDLQPLAIHAFSVAFGSEQKAGSWPESAFVWIFTLFGGGGRMGGISLVAFATAMSASAHWLGAFLTASQSAKDWMTFGKRIAARVAIFVAAMVLPLALWVAYLYLSAALVGGRSWLPDSWAGEMFGLSKESVSRLLPPIAALVALILFAIILDGNAYSLHRFYRDRLSRAFLFWFPENGSPEAKPLDDLKLSKLTSAGPYPIINSALNVQGSESANRRGRNADFFTFTPEFVGSDLTHYAPTRPDASHPRGMEDEVPALDFATAVAISGAAVSANMGSSTVRLLSPTLALLNLRLGYWLRNPRDLAKGRSAASALATAKRFIAGKFHLLAEMLNLLDENSAQVYLTDGGHIENLGLYELLKRGCKLIVVVDAEADPAMSFGGLQVVQRYARIDFGVRIDLPWEAIAARTRAVDAGSAAGSIEESSGPHCAVGRILYANGSCGVLLYVKSSMTGDEQDYILDYKKRRPAFPHETTGDQFFTEEQFEAYRALGFHMVEHFFDQDDAFDYVTEGDGAFASPQEARAAIDYALPGLRHLP